MADALSPAELAAIAAFPEAKVQRIPRGASGYESRYVWHPSSDLGRLVSVGEPQGWKAQRKRDWQRQKASVKRAREARIEAQRAVMNARRDQVARLRETYTAPEMAQMLGASVSTIEYDIRALKKAGRIV